MLRRDFVKTGLLLPALGQPQINFCENNQPQVLHILLDANKPKLITREMSYYHNTHVFPVVTYYQLMSDEPQQLEFQAYNRATRSTIEVPLRPFKELPRGVSRKIWADLAEGVIRFNSLKYPQNKLTLVIKTVFSPDSQAKQTHWNAIIERGDELLFESDLM